MNAPLDLFPELTTTAEDYSDDDRAAFACGLLADWFGTLSYKHSESAHAEILASLDWPCMAAFVSAASWHLQDNVIDFDKFAAGIRHQARMARARGLVVPDGKPRPRAPAAVDLFDLFAGDESGVTV